MFKVIKQTSKLTIDNLADIQTVYGIKTDYETNQIMFLFYDDGKWVYKPADDYMPIIQNEVMF